VRAGRTSHAEAAAVLVAAADLGERAGAVLAALGADEGAARAAADALAPRPAVATLWALSLARAYSHPLYIELCARVRRLPPGWPPPGVDLERLGQAAALALADSARPQPHLPPGARSRLKRAMFATAPPGPRGPAERSVAAALERVGAPADPGARSPRLALDVRLPVTLPGGRLALEVLRDSDLTSPAGGDRSGGSGRRARAPTGAARARARLLEAAGYRVLALDGAAWAALPGDGARDEALRALLAPHREGGGGEEG